MVTRLFSCCCCCLEQFPESNAKSPAQLPCDTERWHWCFRSDDRVGVKQPDSNQIFILINFYKEIEEEEEEEEEEEKERETIIFLKFVGYFDSGWGDGGLTDVASGSWSGAGEHRVN